MMTTQPQMSRRSILSTLAIGVPAMGVLGAINLAGARQASAAPSGRDFLRTAEGRAGCRYILGAKGPNVFDCSGLVHWSLGQLGISFPRMSGPQFNACQPISLEQAWKTPGAILWRRGHIGISCGDNKTSFEARNESIPVGYFDTKPGSPWTNGGLIPGLDYNGTGGNDDSLVIDGYWGTLTTRRLQGVLGVSVDGVISSQLRSWRAKNPGLITGWQWVADSSASGSEVIRALQGKVGAETDGLIGPKTISAMQAHFGASQSGRFPRRSSCIKTMQKALNEGKF